MHINQLIKVIAFISNSIKAKEITEHYKSLIGICRQALNGDITTYMDQVDDLLLRLTNSNKEVDPLKWDKSFLRIFEKFERADLLGNKGAENIRFLFDNEKNNYTKLIAGLEDGHNRVVSLLRQLNQLSTSLEPLVKPSADGGHFLEIEERHHLLHIHFEEALFIKDITQLEKFCRIWSSILSAFSRLTREQTEETRIYDIESSSLTFYTGIKTLNALSKGTYQVLRGYQKILEIKRLQLELEGLELSNKEEIKSMLEEEVINVVDVISSTVTNELLNKYEWNDAYERAYIFNMVQTSLKQTLNFVERGGRIYSHHSNDLKKLNDKIITILQKIYEMETHNSIAEPIDFALDLEEE